jgi:hypothetical protein
MRCALEAEAQLRCVAARTVLKTASADKAAKSAAGKFLLRFLLIVLFLYIVYGGLECVGATLLVMSPIYLDPGAR